MRRSAERAADRSRWLEPPRAVRPWVRSSRLGCGCPSGTAQGEAGCRASAGRRRNGAPDAGRPGAGEGAGPAFQYPKLLDEGPSASISEMAAAEKIERGYLGSLLRLRLLAPDLVELILDGRAADRVALPALLEPVPLIGAHQWEHLMSGKPVQRAKLEVACQAQDCDGASSPIASRASAWQCGRRP